MKHQKDIDNRNINRVNNAQLIILPLGMIFFALFVFTSLGSSKPHKPEKTKYCYIEECMSLDDKTKNTTGNNGGGKSVIKENAMKTPDEPRSLITDKDQNIRPQLDVSIDKEGSKDTKDKTTSKKTN